MRRHQMLDTAGAGHLDRLLDGPMAVLAVVATGWLLLCVRTARRRPAGGLTAGGVRPRGASRLRQVVRAAVAFLGAAGLLSQAGGATAAPVDSPTTAGVQVRSDRGLPTQARTSVTQSVVTDGGEKVPSLWPVGREHLREQPAPVPGDRVVVVHRGDSLWSLARRNLEPEAGRAAIQQAVHAWYALNRSVIGPDRDLILPGQVLHVPRATQ